MAIIKKIQNRINKVLVLNKGFTLIEIIAVMLIVGVMSGIIGISVGDINSSVRLTNAASRTLSDIKELKEIAMNEGGNVSITVNPGADSYTLTVDGVSETVNFNQGDYKGVTISSTDFSGALSFDNTGWPTDNNSNWGEAKVFMNINNGEAQVIVYGNSGMVAAELAEWGGCGGGC
ncbi:MAG: type II secretion system protein [bacterium]